MYEAITCPNCGASESLGGFRGVVFECRYCNTTFRVPVSMTPEPDIGDLLLGADFTEPDIPGWRIVDTDKITFKEGPPPELWAKYPKSDSIHPVLRTPAPFDDFDVSVTIRFIDGKYEQISAGFELRFSDDGDYVIRISAQGTFSVGWHKETDWGDHLVKWTKHPILKTEMGEPNRLRVLMKGDRIRVYINGVMATSLRDERYSSGLVRVVVSPGNDSGIEAVFSSLQLRAVI